MDVCTLVVLTTINTVACYSPVVCEPYNGKTFCTGGTAGACPQPDPWWECKRADGSKYALKWIEGPTSIMVK